jgi:hypothetical protein
MNQLTPIDTISSKAGINAQAKDLIEQFAATLSNKLRADVFATTYSSIDDILIQKFHLSDIDKMDFPDFSRKTEFIPKGVRGNIQKAEGKILTYKEADDIVGKGLNEEMP